MKYKIKPILSVVSAVLFLQACGDAREASSIADAYDAATARVLSATSSEELVAHSIAALLLCHELGYYFQLRNVGLLFQKGIHQKLISKAVDLTLVPD